MDLVEEEFSRPFTGQDFVHNYTFNTVKPLIDLEGSLNNELCDISEQSKDYDNKLKLSREKRDVFLDKRSWWRTLVSSVLP